MKTKSKQDLIKALNELKLEPKPKPETKTKPKPKPEKKPKPETKQKPKQTPKPELTPKPEPEPKLEIRVNKRKLNKLRKDFDELRHKFSKTEIKEYRKAFYIG